MTTHVMVDLEALGNDVKTGSLLAIGAVPFNMLDEIKYPNDADFTIASWEKAFFKPIDLVDQAQYKFDIESDTLQWWLSEGRHVQLNEFMNSPRKESLRSTFEAFACWIKAVCGKQNDLVLWSHGVTYDCMHLTEKWPVVMKRSFNDVCPFRQMRDTRTIFAAYEERFGVQSYSNVERKRHHHPLEDAWIQAKAVQVAWKGLTHA